MSDELHAAPEGTSAPLLEFGPFQFDPVKRLLLRDGEVVPLTPKAVEVLAVLVEHRGRALEKDELMRAVWPDTVVEENNLARSVSSVRKALGEKASEHRYVVTIPGRGYRFVAAVREVTRHAAGSHAPPAPADPSSLDGGVVNLVSAAPGHDRRFVLTVTLAAVAFLLVLVVASFAGPERPRPQHELSSLAVLPFSNVSGDPEQEYLSDGITDALITELAGIRSLHVISNHSVMRYKRSSRSLSAIAQELSVGAVVVGTVMRSGTRIRVNAQLLSAASNQYVWAASYERESGDVLTLQTDIARAVAHEVRGAVTAIEEVRLARRNATVDPETYDLYLRGRYFFNRRGIASNAEAELRKSVRYLEQAIARDPNLAEAHATLAFTYRVIAHRGFLPPWEAARQSEANARRALELDPRLVDAHVGVAANLGFDRWDWAAAERAFQEAIELNPSDAHARLWYSFMLLHLGRMEESAAQSAHGMRNDPFHPLLRENHVLALVALGRGEEAIELARESLELEPARADFLGWVYLRLGREQDALTEFERAGSERGVAYVRAIRGDLSGVRTLLAHLEERSKERYVSPVEFAKLLAVAGEKEQAFARLEEAYRTRAPAVAGIRFSHEFASLRSDPRYFDLLRRMNID